MTPGVAPENCLLPIKYFFSLSQLEAHYFWDVEFQIKLEQSSGPGKQTYFTMTQKVTFFGSLVVIINSI